MKKTMGSLVRLIACAGILGLSGCIQSKLTLSPDFGSAIKQDVRAQVADPDAHYAGVPSPGAEGRRAALAQQRYQTDQVIQPYQLNASSQSSGSGSGNTGGDNSGGSGSPGTGGAGSGTGP